MAPVRKIDVGGNVRDLLPGNPLAGLSQGADLLLLGAVGEGLSVTQEAGIDGGQSGPDLILRARVAVQTSQPVGDVNGMVVADGLRGWVGPQNPAPQQVSQTEKYAEAEKPK